jgi:hypothetical protein
MEVPGHSANGRTVGESRMLTSAQCRPRRRRQGARLAPTEKCHFAPLLPLVVLLAAGVPALAADSIEELPHQDEAKSHNDALRRDLKAHTEELRFSPGAGSAGRARNQVASPALVARPRVTVPARRAPTPGGSGR